MKPKQYTLSELFEAMPLVQTHLAVRMKINRSLLVHYMSGIKTPSPARMLAMETEIHNLGAELMAVELVTPEYRIGFEEALRRVAKAPRPGTKRKTK